MSTIEKITKNFTQKIKDQIDNGLIPENIDINKALLYATEKNNYEAIVKLLDLGASFYYTNNQHMNAFLITTNLKILKLFHKRGADLSRTNTYGYTKLIYAVKYNNDAEIVDYILSMGSHPNQTSVQSNVSPLMFACENLNFEHVKLLVSAGANVNHIDSNGRYTPLLKTCMSSFRNKEKSIEILKFLIENGVDIYHKNNKKICALLYSLEYNNNEIFKIILEKYEHYINFNKFLDICINKKNLEIFELLVENGGIILSINEKMLRVAERQNLDFLKYLEKKGANLNYVDKNGDNIITICSKYFYQTNDEFTEYIFSKGINVSQINKDGNNALINSCKCGNFKFIKYLLKTEYPLFIKDSQLKSPITYLFEKKYNEILKYFIDFFLSNNNISKISQLLFQTIIFDNFEILKYLYIKKINFNVLIKEPNKYMTPLIMSIEKKRYNMIRFLIEYCKSPINYITPGGSSAITISVYSVYTDIMYYLLSKGACINTTLLCLFKKNKTETDYCKSVFFMFFNEYEHGNFKVNIIKNILKMGANIYYVNINGRNALLNACECGNFEVVKFLLDEYNFDLNHIDIDGKTALIHASSYGNVNVVNLLLKEIGYVKVKRSRY